MIKRLLLLIILTFAFVTAAFSYGFLVGTKEFQINKTKISSSEIPASFNFEKIAVFSDTYLLNNYTVEQFKTVVQKINNENPTLIFFLGDLVDMNQFPNLDLAVVQNLLLELEAPAGKFFTLGEQDLANKDAIISLFTNAGFIYLEPNQIHSIYYQTLDALQVATFDPQTDPATMQNILSQISPEKFSFVIHHYPDSFAITKQFPVDVQLSGHSLAGQINIPGLRNLLAPAQGQEFTVSDVNKGAQSLYVNRGLGNQADLPIRLFNAPSIDLYTLEKTTIPSE